MPTLLRRAAALLVACLLVLDAAPAPAQDTGAAHGPLQMLLQARPEAVSNPSRGTVGKVLSDLRAADLPGTADFLRAWQDREVYQELATGLFFFGREVSAHELVLIDLDSGDELHGVTSREVSQIRPNAGVRRAIGAALVRFELGAENPARRIAALEAILRAPDAEQIPLLADSIPDESDGRIRARKERVLDLLTARFSGDPAARVAAIGDLAGDVSTEARRVLNQLLQTEPGFAEALPEDANIARIRTPGVDLSLAAAYDLLASAGLYPACPGRNALRDVLRAHVADGQVGGVPLHRLNTDEARHEAHAALVAAGLTDPLVTEDDMRAAVAAHVFYDRYLEPDAQVTAAARAALDATGTRLALFQYLSISLDALSLASIFFLAAIGLAIIFGVLRVINMAHGEFIMMGAYTGYVVQTVIPDYTLSLIVALPLAFAVAFAAGVALERLVIRHLCTRPLETLLATFGISIALQQLAKNIFGTQARPLTAPDWLAGSIALNDAVSIATTPAEREHTTDLLRRAARTRAVIVIEHDMEFIRRLDGRVTVLHEGAVLAEGTLDHVTRNQQVIDVCLGR